MKRNASGVLGKGTVGVGGFGAKQARLAADSAKRGKKTQGACSGHEACRRHGGKRRDTGKCERG